MADLRTEPYDRAAAMADAGALTEAHADQLVADYRARVDEIFRTERRSAHQPRVLSKSAGAAIGSWIIVAAAIGLLSRLRVVEWLVLASAIAIVVCFQVWLGFMNGRFKVRRTGAQIEFANAPTHMAECLRRRLCPECDYELSGIHPSIDALPERGQELGPRACPECGAKWPLVPQQHGR